jgi:hypothetical protein
LKSFVVLLGAAALNNLIRLKVVWPVNVMPDVKVISTNDTTKSSDFHTITAIFNAFFLPLTLQLSFVRYLMTFSIAEFYSIGL